MTDATQVTGSALVGQGPRPGDVLAERYELVELIDTDGPLLGFRAQDQETERTVLLRILSGPGLHTDTCDKIVERLRGLVGVGGRYLSSLVDADREKRWPFSIEAWPPGTPLSRVLDARRARGPLGPAEALPVIARLASALAALPDEWHHGDVRAERVWLDADGLRLTGAFLLASLPDDERGERIGGLGPGTIAYPPEFRAGRSGRASDRWGVASIGWEALYGRPYEPNAAAAPADRLQRALGALLGEEARRPDNLEELLDALAEAAGLPRPQLDAEPHRPPTARFSWTGPHARLTPRAIEGAATGGTQEIELEQIEEERLLDGLDPRLVRAALSDEPLVETLISPDDTSRNRPIGGDLDPRLVRAALTVDLDRVLDADGATAEPRRDSGPDSLDPRLVRAALGITLDSESDVVDLPSDELEIVEPVSARSSADPANKLATLPSATAKPATAKSAAEPAAVFRKVADRPPGAAARPTATTPSRPPGPRAPAPTPAKPLTRAPAPTPASPLSRASLTRSSPPGPTAAAGQAAPSARVSVPGPVSRPAAASPSRPPGAAKAPGAPAGSPSRPPSARAPAGSPAATPSRPPSAAAPSPTPSNRPAPSPARPSPAPEPPVQARPEPAPVASAPPAARPVAASPTPAASAPASVRPPPRAIAEPTPRPSSPAPRATRALTGILIVVAAVFLAVGIIGIGFLIAAGRRDAAQQRQLGPGVVVAPAATD